MGVDRFDVESDRGADVGAAMKINMQFITRSLIIIFAVIGILLAVLVMLPSEILLRGVSLWITRPLDSTPPPPTITAPRGSIPNGNVGLQEWVIYKDGSRELRGSGFLIKLNSGDVIGVTTAHSLIDLGEQGNRLSKIAFLLPSSGNAVIDSDTLHGSAGVARTTFDLSVDYVLLRLNGSAHSNYVLAPDARGTPQPGERVSLFSGLGDDQGNRRELQGTVFDVEAQGFWVVFDEWFDPGMMSGSPVMSQHTGNVLGMAIVMSPRGDRMTIGFNPIGNLVKQAEGAKEFVKIEEYRR
ncbi:MAG: hypothetical protein HZB17_05715 [Chloroflexi bacterium]|nr:hypothetical protein [Chloroflexota bacterium]MBI5347956.1 hypothetical protein [Chloroflexota bacterium]